jgi:hypothetical protein
MVNWGSAAAGALSGAGTGATLGPWGAAAGGVLGGIAGLFSKSAKNDKLKTVPTGTKEQEALHNSILAQAMGMSQGGGGYDLANQYYNNLLGDNQQQAFDEFSAPYLQQFQEQMLPQIAERFAGVGALSSSGFGQALGGASAGLQSQLAQLFSSLQSQAAGKQYGQYNQLAQFGLGHEPFAYTKNKGSMGFGGPFAAGVSENMEGILNGIMSLFKKKPAESGSTEGIK